MELNNYVENSISNSATVFRGNTYRITVLSERLIRLEYNPEGKFNDLPTEFAINRKFPVPNFTVKQDSKFLEIGTEYFGLLYLKEKPFNGPKYAPDSNLKIILRNTDKIWYYGHPEARNFKGSAYSLDAKGAKTKLLNGLYSTDGFATYDDSKSMIINKDGMLEVPSDKRIDLYLFMYRKDFGLCLRDYFTLTGFPYFIPRYALGIWWNKDQIYSFNDTKKLIKAFNRNDIPLSTLLLGEFWHIKDAKDLTKYRTGYTFNNSLFSDPKEFINYMHERGVRVGLSLDPAGGILPHEEVYPEARSLLGVNQNDIIPLNAFDKKTMEIYNDILIGKLNSYGTDFYWLDYRGSDLYSIRALAYYHMQDKKNENRRLLLTRNPLVAAHRYPVHYSGETEVNWETLDYLPAFNASSSNIGLSWWSHDVGGYKGGIEDSELYIRHVELATFSPIFRFSSRRGMYYKREPWAWDVKTYNIVKEYTRLRHMLIPYIYTEGYKYSKFGTPLIQPLYYFYPEMYDEPLYKNEYYFGSQLFVAPITKQKEVVMNRCIKKLFLPKGVWYDFKTGKKYIGNKRYVNFYKDEDYPVFATSGAIIPLGVLKDNINDTSLPDKMEIHIFPGESNTYELYEDDGITHLNEEGYYTISRIEYDYQVDNYTINIYASEGKYGILPKTRDYIIKLRNTNEASSVNVSLNNSIVEDFTYENVDNDLVITIPNVNTNQKLSINVSGSNMLIDTTKLINEDILSIINDLKIKTYLKERIHMIIFSNDSLSKKRIKIKKLKKEGLSDQFVGMFLRLLEYISSIN